MKCDIPSLKLYPGLRLLLPHWPGSQAIPTSQEESIMLVTSWVLLRLEERIKVPEGALDEIVRRHLSEPAGDMTDCLLACVHWLPNPTPGPALTPSPRRFVGTGSGP